MGIGDLVELGESLLGTRDGGKLGLEDGADERSC